MDLDRQYPAPDIERSYLFQRSLPPIFFHCFPKKGHALTGLDLIMYSRL